MSNIIKLVLRNGEDIDYGFIKRTEAMKLKNVL